jgi:hypothetical protein
VGKVSKKISEIKKFPRCNIIYLERNRDTRV